jgi:hypothetical protein
MGSHRRKKKSTSDNRTIISDLKREADQDALRTALQPTFEGLAYIPSIIAITDFVSVTESVDPSQG